MKDLGKLIRESIDKFNSLTPEQQRRIREEQRRSYILAEAAFGSDRDEAEYREAIASEDPNRIKEVQEKEKLRVERARKYLEES